MLNIPELTHTLLILTPSMMWEDGSVCLYVCVCVCVGRVRFVWVQRHRDTAEQVMWPYHSMLPGNPHSLSTPKTLETHSTVTTYLAYYQHYQNNPSHTSHLFAQTLLEYFWILNYAAVCFKDRLCVSVRESESSRHTLLYFACLTSSQVIYWDVTESFSWDVTFIDLSKHSAINRWSIDMTGDTFSSSFVNSFT